MPVILFLFQFSAGQDNFFSIDDYNLVTGVNMRCKKRIMLSSEMLGNCRGQPSKNNPVSVYYPAFILIIRLFCAKCVFFHCDILLFKKKNLIYLNKIHCCVKQKNTLYLYSTIKDWFSVNSGLSSFFLKTLKVVSN